MELRDVGQLNDLVSIKVPILILNDVNDDTCLFDLAKIMHEGIQGSELVKIDKVVHGF